MKNSLSLKQQQKLKLTPQLQQAIRLLQLSAQELDVEVQAALEANPLLEYDKTDELQEKCLAEVTSEYDNDNKEFNEPQDDGDCATEAYAEEYFLSQNQHNSFDQQHNSIEILEFQNQKAEETSLKQHLLWQANLSVFSKEERLIANTIIDAISDDGYLCCHLEEIQYTIRLQESQEFTMLDIEAVLHKIQQFEPTGVAARHLSECLTIQLNNLPPSPTENPLLLQAKNLVSQYLPLLGTKNYAALCSKLNLSQAKLKEVIRLITKLDPKPGRQISLNKKTEHIIPDLLLKKKKDSFVVELNMDAMPKLRVNTDYSFLLKNAESKETRGLLKQHLKEADWFIKGLDNRYKTLLKVANCLIKEQTAFLTHGEEFLQGLSLETVAKLTSLHESTISRITTHKYIHTHRGVFELKDFFSTELAMSSGEKHSSGSIRAMIRKLIQNEPKTAPLSDEQIKEILASKKIQLSRRTISKYREAMKIPSSTKRHWANSLIEE